GLSGRAASVGRSAVILPRGDCPIDTAQEQGEGNMLFSILVPVYNSEKYLEECFDSVLRQSEQDYELILVDDGSTDGGGAVCDRYRAQSPDRIRVIHQSNQGLILARRAGIAAAKGDYCMFLDADDAYEPKCLSTMRETIERTRADVVIFNNYSYFEEDGSIEPNKAVFADQSEFVGEQKRLIYQELFSSERLNNIWLKAIRTPLLQDDDTDYILYADNPHGEDLLQSLYPLTHAQKIVYRDQVLYRYRRHSSSMTRVMELQRLERMFDDKKEQQLRRYMTIWGMDTQKEIDQLQARKTRGTLTLFWQNYRAAKSNDQKRAVQRFPWATRFAVQERRTFENPYLSRMHRLQVRAILHQTMWLLDGICALGKLKMRAQHGA
ncbi:MAG: glycosyltransferase, partial [Eubacteriales bacterium]|nr:glycosyltransferase [Eubacteriales bacterium]